MSPSIAPPNSVLLLVGRDEFQPPSTFSGATCVATQDCIAVAVLNADDGPTQIDVAESSGELQHLVSLGEFLIESEGQVSVRDVYNREYLSVGVAPGIVPICVRANDVAEPSEVVFVIQPH